MIRNYFLIAVRNIIRDKVFSAINIVGLAVGIACFLALFLFVQDELTFDQSAFDSSQIYRVYVKIAVNGSEETSSKTAQVLGPILQQNYPEVKSYMRIGSFGPRAFKYNDKLFRSGSINAVDSTFFKIFAVQFIEGDPASALVEPNSIVLTETAAKRIFGNESPVGKLLPTESGQNFKVTALVKDFSRKSHFHCDYLESLSTYKVNENWLDNLFTTYLVLQPGTDVADFEKKLQRVVVDDVGPEIQKLLGVSIDQFFGNGAAYSFHLQPFSSIYLYSQRDYGIDLNTESGAIRTSDITYTYMFSAIAIFILILAVINFMNLSTAKSARRAREVGVRKTFGSARSLLIFQFIGEAILTSSIAMLLAVSFLTLLLPFFNILLEKDLSLLIINQYWTAPILIGFTIVVGVLAGSYPAFYLSSFVPAKVLKGDSHASRKSMLRNGLVILQFGISICLLIGTFVIKQQLDFIQNKNLGFNKEHLLSINNINLLGDHIETFREKLLNNANIVSVTHASHMFTAGIPGAGYLFNKKTGTDPFLCQFIVVDYDFLKTFQVDLKQGRFFSKEFPADVDAVVVNEAAAAAFATDDVIGKELVSLDARSNGHGYKIIGVISDFNYESLHTKVRPLVLHLQMEDHPANNFMVRIASDDMSNTIRYISDKWKEIAPGEAMNYNFIDITLARLYVAEQKTNMVSVIFSSVAIFIACIGLFGLAAFVAEQRTKEIGIRKVLGATSRQVVLLLLKEFAAWVLISNIIAWPVAWYVMNGWLENFAFHTEMSVSYFLIAGIVTFLIASITVGFHAVKAAQTNPVASMKFD
ncbi:putative ABC transport system permease protein [Chryseolinea serpens]|uniref:Putative ABC transport system permease protein n=1 Tax=Chryseolinea serpens TaxID=947013 RepID=A0A1M5MNK0_9BACT|nr:ABC transporter permease [Chryseolinea serpens]SHG78489.1 putative ABC transport system permease protein [Chryseolinea serpens]